MTSKKLDILFGSLAKKEAELQRRFDAHFADVRSANGQPMNDKRNGQATLNRWERQSEGIRNQKASIEKTKRAIHIEQDKVANVEAVNEALPSAILDLVERGELTQWRRHPNTFFVPGVDKARIVWCPKKNILGHRYTRDVTDKDQWRTFARTFNALNIKLHAEGEPK